MDYLGCLKAAWAYRAPLDVVNDICINARPVKCLSGLGLHLLHPLMCTVEVSEGPIEKLGEYAGRISLQENTGLDEQLIPGAPEVISDTQHLLLVVRSSPENEAIQGVVDQVTLYSSSDSIQFVSG